MKILQNESLARAAGAGLLLPVLAVLMVASALLMLLLWPLLVWLVYKGDVERRKKELNSVQAGHTVVDI